MNPSDVPAEVVAAALNADYEEGVRDGRSYHQVAEHQVRRLIAGAVAAERERIAALLRRAAAGRREYATQATEGSEFRAILLKSAEHYESAAWLIGDPRNMLDVMPSWMWTGEENASLKMGQP